MEGQPVEPTYQLVWVNVFGQGFDFENFYINKFPLDNWKQFITIYESNITCMWCSNFLP